MSYKVLGLGDDVVDKYINHDIMYPGGNALNFCAYSHMLEREVAFCGKFGSDQIAAYIKSVLEKMRIEYSHSRNFEGENGYALVELIDGDRNFISSNKGGVAKENPWNFTDADLAYFKEFALIHTSLNSYIESDLPKVKEADVPISYDFSNRWTDEYLKEVCPNIDIAFLSTCHLNHDERRRELKKVLDLGVKIAVGTVGEDGSYAMFGDKEVFQPAFLQETVKDTMGAGDSYLTAFLHKLLELSTGKLNLEKEGIAVDIAQAMEAGARFSAKVCQIDGAFGYGTKII